MAPKSASQFKEEREKSRAAIMDTALELFAHNGYYGTSMERIAKKCGISKGLIYNYFRSKDDLLKSIFDNGMNIIKQLMMDTFQEKKTPQEQLLAFIDMSLNKEVINDHFWRFYFSLMVNPDISDIHRTIFTKEFKTLFKLLENVFEKLGAPDPFAESRIFGAILDGVGLHYMLSPNDYPVDEVRKRIIARYKLAEPIGDNR